MSKKPSNWDYFKINAFLALIAIGTGVEIYRFIKALCDIFFGPGPGSGSDY